MRLGQRIDARTTAIATVIALSVILAVYWRLLVMREPGTPPSGGGGGPMGPSPRMGLGRADVDVEMLSTMGPGYRDGAAWEAQFSGPAGLAVDPEGAVYVADSRNHRIRLVRPDGSVSTVAGGAPPGGSGGMSTGPVQSAQLRYPAGVALDGSGRLYVADTGNHRLCRVQDGRLESLAGTGRPGNRDGAGAQAEFDSPSALAFQGDSLWVLDAGSGRIRKVDPSGKVTTPAEPPAPVRTLLGQTQAAAPAGPILTSAEGIDIPAADTFTLGTRSAGVAGAKGSRYFADLDNNVLMCQPPGSEPILLAGRRIDGSVDFGNGDGFGHNASFETLAAVAMLPDGNLVVSEFDGNRLRKILLPDWLKEANPPPPRRRREAWRRRRGS